MTGPETGGSSEARRKRLLFRAQRRGFKEVDIVFGTFAAAELDTLDETELDQFEALLDAPDQEVYAWLRGQTPAPAPVRHAAVRADDGALQPQEPDMERLTYIAREQGRLAVTGAPGGYDAYLAAEAARRSGGLVIFVATEELHAAAVADGVRFFAPDVTVLSFPAWDCLPYDRMSPKPDIESERLATLAAPGGTRQGFDADRCRHRRQRGAAARAAALGHRRRQLRRQDRRQCRL